MYPPNPTKSWTAGGWGQIAIEEGGGATELEVQKNKGCGS